MKILINPYKVTVGQYLALNAALSEYTRQGEGIHDQQFFTEDGILYVHVQFYNGKECEYVFDGAQWVKHVLTEI